MISSLVTFLGRVDNAGHYQPTRYHFPDGHEATATFLGYALGTWLKADRLVILGTTGSMWDNLFEDCGNALDETHQMALLEAREHSSFTQQQLDTLAPVLETHRGQKISLQMIPSSLDDEGQSELLRTLANAAEGCDALSMDVTHGFRHLPMFAMTAAIYLRALHPQLEIAGLWYGELQGNDADGLKRGQIHDLSGLLKTIDWLAALQQYDWVGSFSGVSRLVREFDPELGRQLEQASFLESIHRTQASQKSKSAAKKLLESTPLQGAGSLFSPILRERLETRVYPVLYLPQRRAALAALERGDYLRAALYGLEAFITKLTQEELGSSQAADHSNRKAIREKFEKGLRTRKDRTSEAYRQLYAVRNAMAHGSVPDRRDEHVILALKTPENLESLLRNSIKTLLPDAN